ncbi:YmdB family metallophosphoesterase [Treponema sp. OMZ 305]|uniref:TIGR00282 family metallophosphoesterase n=1 Tax=Treponema sp. OMZ 305 TaxID=1659192 RepID=UPI0020A4A107|nr:TIGR00282 family metallophosphoesterase [Treponema sp. OMZ 305]UTC56835.1 YmdB family metallophosphoesterase [Treponema sp. OMZ 305]
MGGELTLFFGGDICGTFGVDIALQVIPELLKAEKPDFIIVNGENAAKGSGIELEQAERLFAAGVDVITGGNHTMERFDLRAGFGQEPRILRPANYPLAPGSGIITVRKPQGTLTVLNIQGRENMRPIDCPFQTVDRLLAEQADGIVMVDFHAESVQEKEALAYYLDGRVSCVFGSHTHTQTADERILAGGTGYITDAGMIGAYHSIIGSSIEAAVARSLTLTPQTFDIPESGEALFCGIIAKVSSETKKTLSLKRIYKAEI